MAPKAYTFNTTSCSDRSDETWADMMALGLQTLATDYSSRCEPLFRQLIVPVNKVPIFGANVMNDLETLKYFKMRVCQKLMHITVQITGFQTREACERKRCRAQELLLCFTYSNRFKRLAFATSRVVTNVSSRRHRFSHVTSAELVAAKCVFSLSQKNSACQSQFQKRLGQKSTREFPEDGCIQSFFSYRKKATAAVLEKNYPA
ncbi:Hypothetical_protein [Hexamita inflata]|uniref:Hypothetical_protein n=1 Tax=Hexamita inflata TaxID=28002 RepID=A0AA86UL80_9EUKA|nr:Hypothetical protein HINF_LOCUS50205 [Hexamita inflata]